MKSGFRSHHSASSASDLNFDALAALPALGLTLIISPLLEIDRFQVLRNDGARPSRDQKFAKRKGAVSPTIHQPGLDCLDVVKRDVPGVSRVPVEFHLVPTVYVHTVWVSMP